MKPKLTKVQKKSYAHRALSEAIHHGELLAMSISPDHMDLYSETYQAMGYSELQQRYSLWQEWHSQIKSQLKKKEWQGFIDLETLPFVKASEIWEALIKKYQTTAKQLELNPDPQTGELSTLGSFWRILGPMIQQQCVYLRDIREQRFPERLISRELAFRYAAQFKHINPETIDRLFSINGVGFWWIEPCNELKSKRQTYVLGWLDGIMLHEPESLLMMMQNVLQSLASYQNLPEPNADLMQALQQS